MSDYLDPDHWVNGGEHDFSHPVAKAFTELETENKQLRAALERIRDCNFVITLPDRMDAVRAIAREALE